jgi:hypothetical protein
VTAPERFAYIHGDHIAYPPLHGAGLIEKRGPAPRSTRQLYSRRGRGIELRLLDPRLDENGMLYDWLEVFRDSIREEGLVVPLDPADPVLEALAEDFEDLVPAAVTVETVREARMLALWQGAA